MLMASPETTWWNLAGGQVVLEGPRQLHSNVLVEIAGILSSEGDFQLEYIHVLSPAYDLRGIGHATQPPIFLAVSFPREAGGNSLAFKRSFRVDLM